MAAFARIFVQSLVEPQPWHQFLADMRGQEWVVYAKPPLQEPQHVLTSLARYTHRVAISNHRRVALEGGQVTFRSKDYQRGHRLRTLTLDAVEFLRRLMLHVPPHGFMQFSRLCSVEERKPRRSCIFGAKHRA